MNMDKSSKKNKQKQRRLLQAIDTIYYIMQNGVSSRNEIECE